MSEAIDHGTLSQLAQAGVISGTQIVAQEGSWFVRVRLGEQKRLLTSQRSRKLRLFRRMETLVAYLKSLGITRFDVDASAFEADAPVENSRPDRARAMKQIHEAAAYEQWFRKQVQQAVDDDSQGVSDADARRQFAAKRAALLQGT